MINIIYIIYSMYALYIFSIYISQYYFVCMSEKHVICVSFAQVFRHLLGLSALSLEYGFEPICSNHGSSRWGGSCRGGAGSAGQEKKNKQKRQEWHQVARNDHQEGLLPRAK